MSREFGQLLREYIEHGSDQAFAQIVEHHLQMVYATALRRVGGNQELARDIAQIVFADLASKARNLPPNVVLAGWLYRHTTYVASNTLRGEMRRERREREAALMQSIDQEHGHADWSDALPLLDDSLASLGAADRDAIILRYFQGLDLRSVGSALGTSEDAAHKRVGRALERLRILFQKRGVSISAKTIAAGLVGQGATSAPAVATVASAALASVIPATSVATVTPVVIMTKLKICVACAALTGVVTVPYVLQQQTLSKLRADNAALRSAAAQTETTSAAPPVATNAQAAPAEIELARLRAEVTRLRQETQQLARASARAALPARISLSQPPRPGRPAMRDYIPSDTWRDAGLGSPEMALQTIGWAIRNGDIPRYKQTVYISDDARRVFNDMLAKMPPQALAEVQAKGLGVEEGLLLPAMAQDRKDTYKAFRIASQEFLSDEELVVQAEIETASGVTHKRPMRFRRIGEEWKQYYGVEDLQNLK